MESIVSKKRKGVLERDESRHKELEGSIEASETNNLVSKKHTIAEIKLWHAVEHSMQRNEKR